MRNEWKQKREEGNEGEVGKKRDLEGKRGGRIREVQWALKARDDSN